MQLGKRLGGFWILMNHLRMVWATAVHLVRAVQGLKKYKP